MHDKANETAETRKCLGTSSFGEPRFDFTFSIRYKADVEPDTAFHRMTPIARALSKHVKNGPKSHPFTMLAVFLFQKDALC